MGTKKYLFWLCLSLALLVSCESLRIKTTDHQQVPTSEPTEPDQPVEEPIVAKRPEFLSKKAPALGVILGGGGALTYAHLGVLQEFENQKIPIRAIAGLEWGALIAATYSVNGKAHAAEWKLLKLPLQNFDKKSFFSSSAGGAKVSSFDSFLNDLFQKRAVADLSPPFACASLQIKQGQASVHQSGAVKNVIKSCWPYPPHFDVEAQLAHPQGIQKLAQILKNQGAEIIVYIDVIANNELLPPGSEFDKNNVRLLWAQNKAISPSSGQLGVNEVIALSLPQSNMKSYQSLRALVRMGQLKSQEPIKSLAKKYDY